MNLMKTSWRFWIFTAAVFVRPSAESQSNLTCEVKRQPDGSVRYQLSGPLSSSGCDTDWTDINMNRTVIATHSSYDETLVLNRTRQDIVLKDCRDDLYYTQDCFGDFHEAHCRVNCSRLSDTTPTNTVNSTLTCVFGSWCPDQLTIGLSITGILLLAACAFGCCYLWKCKTCRRRETMGRTISYTPANEEVRVELEKVVII